MLEAPEALIIAEQMNKTVKGRTVIEMIAGYTPHRFTFMSDDKDDYDAVFSGKVIGDTFARGGMVEINIGDEALVLTDGCNITHLPAGSKLPKKHQLLICLDDDSCIVVSVRMYGGILHFHKGVPDGKLGEYYATSKSKVQVMSDDFSEDYFLGLIGAGEMQNKSAKAALATQQSIPGLGNGVLQDILYNAGVHPKRKISTLSDKERKLLYRSVVETLADMYRLGGRSSENDLHGNSGRYIAALSKETAGAPCPKCGYVIVKESYMGGAIYFCPGCQKL